MRYRQAKKIFCTSAFSSSLPCWKKYRGRNTFARKITRIQRRVMKRFIRQIEQLEERFAEATQAVKELSSTMNSLSRSTVLHH